MVVKKILNLTNKIDNLNRRVRRLEFIVYSSLLLFGGISLYNLNMLDKYSRKRQNLLKKKN